MSCVNVVRATVIQPQADNLKTGQTVLQRQTECELAGSELFHHEAFRPHALLWIGFGATF